MRPSSRSVAALVLAVLSAASPPAQPYGLAPAEARHGMVASASPIASSIGAQVLKQGGNAADAAVAVGFALAVVWPMAGNLGGGGFLLIRTADGKSEIVDYRERAPRAATRDMYLDASGKVAAGASAIGYRAVAVPGTVAGLALAHARHGKLPWATLLEPARRLAAGGVVVDGHLAESIRRSARQLADSEDARRIFLPGGKPPAVGDRLFQPELATTIARLQKAGPREFYEGETARRLVADMAAHRGLITARDLAEYQPTLRQPLIARYHGYQLLTMPPPSSGGILLVQILGMLEHYDLKSLGFHSADHIHLMIETMRRAFADRGAFLGDADFVKVPVAGLISARYLADRAKTIDPVHATPSRSVRAGNPHLFERPETTHYSIVDAEGNAISNTYTLNGAFGASVVAHGTGVVLNDEMDDFAASPTAPNMYGLVQGEANAIAPGKRPLSTMTPTMLLKNGKLLYALGSPGGPTIVSTVVQTIVNIVDFDMNLRQAIEAPRVHHQWVPDQIQWEPFGLTRETRAALESRGHVLSSEPCYMGDAEAVGIDPATGVRVGASDPRLGGAAIGY